MTSLQVTREIETFILFFSGLVPARAADVAEVEPEDDDEEEGVSLLSRRLCDGPIQVQPFFFCLCSIQFE